MNPPAMPSPSTHDLLNDRLQTWRQQNRLRGPEAQAMVDRLECLWEGRQLRATIDEDLATDPSRTLQDRGRARL